MDIEQYIKAFIGSPDKMRKYAQAVNTLEELGLKFMLESLGRPRAVNYADPAATQIQAFRNAESIGWHQAMNAVFDFPVFAGTLQVDAGQGTPDFGSDDILADKIGATKEELDK